MQEINRLLTIMTQLREPETGCPWDVEQDFASIAPYTLEEAFEVVDAIERGNMADLREELGDLLLQVVFHSQMAAEAGLFSFDDVAASVNKKMIRRHPHVFLKADSQPSIDSAADQLKNWEAIKASEKTAKGQASVMDDVPVSFPALVRAQKLGKKAAKSGFDWSELPPVFDKVQEEISELKVAIADNSNIEEELGDLLFAVVNVARHTGVDAETALRKASAKFERRFRAIEADLPEASSLEAKEALWKKIKANQA